MPCSVAGTSNTALTSPGTRAAVAYARRMHAGQRQGDGTSFLAHPLEVAALLDRAGAAEHVVIAGVLNDVLEKTAASEAELERRFGQEVTRLVLAVSDNDAISGYAKRKAALRHQVAAAGDEALTLFAADKLSKLRELRREMQLAQDGSQGGASRGRVLRARRLRHYQHSLALLQERLPRSPLVAALHDELQLLLRERVPAS